MNSSRKVGRPTKQTDARKLLIDSARDLFIVQSYDKVSTRLIATKAGVNVAMIRYYFGNKEKNNLWDWVRDAYKKKLVNGFANVQILITKSGRIIDSSFNEISKGRKIFERKFPMNLKEIMENSLIETSLSRVWQHINDPNSSFTVLSFFLILGHYV